MDDAVRTAFALATPGGTVVLAPACSSFDMFGITRSAGGAFKEAVRAGWRQERERGVGREHVSSRQSARGA